MVVAYFAPRGHPPSCCCCLCCLSCCCSFVFVVVVVVAARAGTIAMMPVDIAGEVLTSCCAHPAVRAGSSYAELLIFATFRPVTEGGPEAHQDAFVPDSAVRRTCQSLHDLVDAFVCPCRPQAR